MYEHCNFVRFWLSNNKRSKKGTPAHVPLGPGHSPAMAALTQPHLLQPKQSFACVVLSFGDSGSFWLVAGSLLHHQLCVRPLWLARAPSAFMFWSNGYTPTSVSQGAVHLKTARCEHAPARLDEELLEMYVGDKYFPLGVLPKPAANRKPRYQNAG